MNLPTPFRIASAHRCAKLIGSTTARADAVQISFQSATTQGIYRSQDLIVGQDLLAQLGWLARSDDDIVPSDGLQEFASCQPHEAVEFVVARILELERPVWLSAAVRNEAISQEYVPGTASTQLSAIIPDPERREALLLAAGNRFDQDELDETGRLGEIAVLEACRGFLRSRGRSELAHHVRHVSLISDALGYDIVSPTLEGDSVRLEVKTTSLRSNNSAFLTRLEASVGSRDRNWRLILCSRSGEAIRIIGFCSYDALVDQLPQDRPPGAWSAVKLTLHSDSLIEGLPL